MSSDPALLGAPLAAVRYDRVLALVAPLMIGSQYLLYWACERYIKQPKLNAEALKHHSTGGQMSSEQRSHFWKEVSGQVWCCCFHILFSSVALFGAGCYIFGELTPERRVGDYEGMLVAGDVEFLHLQETAALLGSIFAALMASFLFYWFLGWDNDKLQLFHHLAFIGVTVVLARRCSMAFVGITAMAMEGSSPALALMQIFRQLEGELNAKLSTIFTLCFVVSFIFLRVFLFGYGLLATLNMRMTRPQLFPIYVPGWEIDVVLLLLLSGWMLQLYWASQIFKKMARMMQKQQKSKAA